MGEKGKAHAATTTTITQITKPTLMSHENRYCGLGGGGGGGSGEGGGGGSGEGGGGGDSGEGGGGGGGSGEGGGGGVFGSKLLSTLLN